MSPVALWWLLGGGVVLSRLVVTDGFAGKVVLTLGSICAAGLAWLGVRRASDGRTTSRWIALGLTLFALGLVVFGLAARVTLPAAVVLLADVGWIGGYLAVALGLRTVLRECSRNRRLRSDRLIDTAAIFLAVVLLEWHLSMAEILSDGELLVWARVVRSMYPVMDAMLIALVVQVLVTRRSFHLMPLLVAGGAGIWFLSDVVWSSVDATDLAIRWVEAGWLTGLVLLAAATWHGTTEAGLPTADTERPRVTRLRIAVSLATLLVPSCMAILVSPGEGIGGLITLLSVSVLLVVLAYVRMSRLVGDQLELRAVLRSRERHAVALAANSADAVALLDTRGRLVADSAQLAHVTGTPASGAGVPRALDLIAAEDEAAARSVFERALLEPGRVQHIELRDRQAAGMQRWFDVRLVSLLHDPDVQAIVANVHDITERRQAEEELAHQAFHDGLTGLANRALFADRIGQALRRAARTGLDPVVMLVDLDGFKRVNDSLGHAGGDEVIRLVADRLHGIVRSEDTVARLGADEFAILVEYGGEADTEATAVAGRIMKALHDPVEAAGQQILIAASVGIVVADAEATVESLICDADMAMHHAKARGTNQAVLFEAGMRRASLERAQLETDLPIALESGQLRLVYQPVIALEDEGVVGFEALLRWTHPTLGMVPPDKFIPIAEQAGLIVPIGKWVLQEAVGTVARWQQSHPALTMAVNVSAHQLTSDALVADVADVLRSSGIDPGSLVLEMTETSLVKDPEETARRLHCLRELGVRLAIDDFGTGYSSLSYLRQFPVDILKIDRSFVGSIVDPDTLPPIVRGLLELGRTLGLEIVAEGVEHPFQRDQLRGERCLLAQGYLFSRPLDVADAEALLLHGNRKNQANRPGCPLTGSDGQSEQQQHPAGEEVVGAGGGGLVRRRSSAGGFEVGEDTGKCSV